jgi:hypothetical protein
MVQNVEENEINEDVVEECYHLWCYYSEIRQILSSAGRVAERVAETE